MAITVSPSVGTTIPLSTSTTFRLTTSSNVSTHSNGTSGIFYWSVYDSSGNSLGESGAVGSDGYGSKTATYTITPSNYVQNGVYPSYIEVFGWFVTTNGTDPEMGTTYRWDIETPPVSFDTIHQPVITQNDDGTFTASWTSASVSGGAGGTPQYRLWNVTDGDCLTDYSGSTSVTLDIPSYEQVLTYRVEVYYSESSEYSKPTQTEFIIPSLSAPSNVRLSSSSGSRVTISWTASILYKTSLPQGSSIKYSIYVDGTYENETTETSFTFFENTTSTWGNDPVALTVVANANTVSKHYPSRTSGVSSEVTFTYSSSGSIMYYTGGQWVECIVHYYTGGQWVECVPHYYINGGWIDYGH